MNAAGFVMGRVAQGAGLRNSAEPAGSINQGAKPQGDFAGLLAMALEAAGGKWQPGQGINDLTGDVQDLPGKKLQQMLQRIRQMQGEVDSQEVQELLQSLAMLVSFIFNCLQPEKLVASEESRRQAAAQNLVSRWPYATVMTGTATAKTVNDGRTYSNFSAHTTVITETVTAKMRQALQVLNSLGFTAAEKTELMQFLEQVQRVDDMDVAKVLTMAEKVLKQAVQVQQLQKADAPAAKAGYLSGSHQTKELEQPGQTVTAAGYRGEQVTVIRVMDDSDNGDGAQTGTRENTNHHVQFKEQPVTANLYSRADNAAFSRIFQQVSHSRTGEHIFQQLVQKSHLLVAEGKQEIHVQLKPDYLGRLSFKVEHADSGIVARLAVESQKVREMIRQHLPQLQQALQEQGIKVDQMEVTVQEHGAQGQQFFQFMNRQGSGRRGSYGYNSGRFGAENSGENLAASLQSAGSNQLVDYLA